MKPVPPSMGTLGRDHNVPWPRSKFHEWDTNKDGVISQVELDAHVNDADVVMARLDVDGTGALDASEIKGTSIDGKSNGSEEDYEPYNKSTWCELHETSRPTQHLVLAMVLMVLLDFAFAIGTGLVLNNYACGNPHNCDIRGEVPALTIKE